MRGIHNLLLRAPSIVAPVIASYTVLDLADRITASVGRTRRVWLVDGAATPWLAYQLRLYSAGARERNSQGEYRRIQLDASMRCHT